MAEPPLRVAVLSPQPVVRYGLVELLSQHPDRVAVVAYPNGVDPDVLLFDVVSLADEDTTALDDLLRTTGGRVLAVSRDLRPDLVARALATGVHGWVSIGVDETELVEAVESAASGQTASSDATPAPRVLGRDVGLTERETEVLTLIAQGRTNQEIARTLFLSPNSIKTYVRTAYRKIGAASRSQAVGWAVRNGFPTDGA